MSESSDSACSDATRADALRRLGFGVAGWSNTPKQIVDIGLLHAGEAGLALFLNRTDILVCLLPLTPDTRHILRAGRCSPNSQRWAARRPCVLINAGRGGLQNETDILSCLDDNTLAAATLDVFETEPLKDRQSAMEPSAGDHSLHTMPPIRMLPTPFQCMSRNRLPISSVACRSRTLSIALARY